MQKGAGIRTYKDTFWSKKRVEANVTVRELAETLGLNEKTLGAYFTGCLMPKEPTVKALCEWFGVDYLQGEREFRKAHRAYDAQVRGKHTVLARSIKKTQDNVSEEVKPITVVKADKPEVGMSDSEKMTAILRLVYSSRKLDYDTFCVLSQMSFDRLKETVYSKVDYAVYTTIENIIDGKCAKVENFDDKWRF